jgi:chromosome segregation ATPase
MSLIIAELEAEIPALQAEIPLLQGEIEELRKQRSTFRVAVAFPKNNSPEALAEFHQHNASAAANWIEQLKEIDRRIQALESQVKQKQSQLVQKQALLDKLIDQQQLLEIERRVQAGGKRLQSQGQKINQLAAQLEAEILSFRAIYEEVNPIYCQWLQKTVNIADFSTSVIPHVYFQGNRFELANKEIEWSQESEVDGGE